LAYCCFAELCERRFSAIAAGLQLGVSGPFNERAVLHQEVLRRMKGDMVVPSSVLEAIKMGIWDFEPDEVGAGRYKPTKAMPGTVEKLEVLATRVESGLPLWHTRDRRSYDDSEI
jgi:hypothetical protein